MKKLRLLFTLPVVACATVELDDELPLPAHLKVPDVYHNDAGSVQLTEAPAGWWERFGNSTLDQLIEKATQSNLDIVVSTARLRQARETHIQTQAGRVPSPSISAGVGKQINRDGDASTNLSLSADAAWEADLFGGVTRSIEGSRAEAQGAAYDLAAVRVAITAEIAGHYIEARLAQLCLEIVRNTLAIAQENMEIAGWRVQAGLVSSLDAEQARASRAQTAAGPPNLASRFAKATNRLSVLTGGAPGELRTVLARPQLIPTVPAVITAGIPADTPFEKEISCVICLPPTPRAWAKPISNICRGRSLSESRWS